MEARSNTFRNLEASASPAEPDASAAPPMPRYRSAMSCELSKSVARPSSVILPFSKT